MGIIKIILLIIVGCFFFYLMVLHEGNTIHRISLTAKENEYLQILEALILPLIYLAVHYIYNL